MEWDTIQNSNKHVQKSMWLFKKKTRKTATDFIKHLTFNPFPSIHPLLKH